MEHASVAAFARFSLELLALGAPAWLLNETAKALGDEIQHAKLCFGLASACAGRVLEPGPLPVAGALDAISWVESVCTAISEACIGETLAAAEAAEAREHCREPAIKAVLERIAEDEYRHAELGWKFLRWALGGASPADRERVARAAFELVEAELARPTDAVPGTRSPELLAYGVLTPALRADVRRSTLRELVGPLLRALCDRAGTDLPPRQERDQLTA
jgi:hypothetical protein